MKIEKTSWYFELSPKTRMTTFYKHITTPCEMKCSDDKIRNLWPCDQAMFSTLGDLVINKSPRYKDFVIHFQIGEGPICKWYPSAEDIRNNRRMHEALMAARKTKVVCP